MYTRSCLFMHTQVSLVFWELLNSRTRQKTWSRTPESRDLVTQWFLLVIRQEYSPLERSETGGLGHLLQAPNLKNQG